MRLPSGKGALVNYLSISGLGAVSPHPQACSLDSAHPGRIRYSRTENFAAYSAAYSIVVLDNKSLRLRKRLAGFGTTYTKNLRELYSQNTSMQFLIV
jgi:hypothetical protein